MKKEKKRLSKKVEWDWGEIDFIRHEAHRNADFRKSMRDLRDWLRSRGHKVSDLPFEDIEPRLEEAYPGVH